MSAFDELQKKQERGEKLTSLEFAVWWCSDRVAAKEAAEELAAKNAEIVRLKAAIKKIANMKNYKLKSGETLHEAYYTCYSIAEIALQEKQ